MGEGVEVCATVGLLNEFFFRVHLAHQIDEQDCMLVLTMYERVR